MDNEKLNGIELSDEEIVYVAEGGGSCVLIPYF